jgi:16S rRNA (uracil1498-N3)-methyltransferase
MATPRFLVDSIANDLVWLEGREARHASGARRLGVGDEVIVFDGAGGEARGRIAEVGEQRVAVSILERRHAAKAGASLALFVAMPKGDRADWLVEKTAELGVARLVPLKTERGVVVPSASRIERWGRKCVEAAKQSSATVAMKIEAPLVVEAVSGRASEFARLLVGERADDAIRMADLMNELERGETAVVVGPEGGFSPKELGRLQTAGGRPVRLGDSILRIETAAIAFAAAWAMSAGRRV